MAALGVFLSHGMFLYALQLPVPFPGHSLGSLSVYVFFFISGYLVTQSWMRDSSWKPFLLRRVARVFPGLIVAVCFSVVVVGWAVTTLPTLSYWSASGTWLNLANNAVGLATVQTLPGVFESNPFARAVNGSLWTIRYELFMYLLLLVVATCARSQRWIYPLCIALLAVAWSAARLGNWDAALNSAATAGGWKDGFRWKDFCNVGVVFFVGCTFAVYEVRPRGWMAVVAVLAAICAYYAHTEFLRQLAVWSMVVCGVFYAAHAGAPAKQVRGRVDISYGVYIYAFPIQQAATELCLRQDWSLAVCLALSLGVVLVLATLSWHCVEQPFINAVRGATSPRRRGLNPA